MIITIDGPTASGKSTVAHLLATQLGYMYINSGLLFRGLAWLLIKQSKTIVPSEQNGHHNYETTLSSFKMALANHPHLLDIHSLETLIAQESFDYRFDNDKGPEVYICHQQITSVLKAPDIDQVASIIGTHASVRQLLLDYQRKLARTHNVVADGRDCGTAVFPYADFKFFLTASLEVRVSRWLKAQNAQGKSLSLEDAKKIIVERDERDSTRSIAPLKPAADAYIIDSSDMTIQEVITEITAVVG